MNAYRKNQAESDSAQSMCVHSRFTLSAPGFTPQRVGSSRGSELLGLRVQGLCCPLQQRPSSGRGTHRGTAASRGGGPEVTVGGALSVRHHRARSTETAECPTVPCNERQAHHGHPGAAMVSELHLYLPLCGDEEQETKEPLLMRSSAEETTAQEVPSSPGCFPPTQQPGQSGLHSPP
ncbi:hypothetical protein PBY51_003432 [Eleginops maclovinus]|uniref:Uncharacterized protein n=1 Tax=Eleginops maclovinus TaxID=56733 RepID=A0AAN7Y2C1_ELEMC|nr:hypothetical protein PBY51_003432 [Eleginops maclovinus]